MKNYEEDFDFFWDLIYKNINFTFSRYADGEVMLMKGLPISRGTQAYDVDKWDAPNNLTKLGKDLIKSLNHVEDDFYYAISSKSDNLDDYEYLIKKIKSKNVTFVNLWINKNYPKMIQNLQDLKRPVNLICNQKAKKEKYPFVVSDFLGFPHNCVNFWESNSQQFTEKILNFSMKKTYELFFISCGPVSEVIIDILYKNNSKNTYIDVGSSLDEFTHGHKTRPYMYSETIYSKMISTF